MAGDLERELKRLLENAGCHYVRAGKGSHEIWYSPITKRNFPQEPPYRQRCTEAGRAAQILLT